MIWPTRLRAFASAKQDLFYCPSQDPKCAWKDDNAPLTMPKAEQKHARYGYRLGEPLLDSVRRFFSYGYNCFGADGGSRNIGLGFAVDLTNPAAVPRSEEVRASRIRRPAEMIAVSDSVADGWADTIISPTSDDYVVDPNQIINPDHNPGPFSRWPGKIHSGGANVLFCDGHVQWYRQADLIISTDRKSPGYAVNRMWNNDHRIDQHTP